jgi:molybdopterin-guanine dinucleotide biosynthesis protein A
MAETNAGHAGIILAGGQARRLSDKPFRPLGGKPLLAHAVARAAGQTALLALGANEPKRFAGFGLPVVADTIAGFVGPLAGILAGMEWAAEQGMADLASFPCDAPFFPRDLVPRLAAARTLEGATIARAASGGRAHPVFALWPVRLRGELRHALVEEGMRKVDGWSARYRIATVEFPTMPFDPFFNINTPDDLATAETLLATGTSADNDAVDRMGKP